MGKKVKDIGFGKRFRYKENVPEYSFQLKKSKWWLLLLLAPLLFLIKCGDKNENGDKDESDSNLPEYVVVHVVDYYTEDDISGALVCWKNQLLVKSNELITDANGGGLLTGVNKDDHFVLTFFASAEGYETAVYDNVRIPDDLECENVIMIKLRPIIEDYHVDIVMCIDNTGSMTSFLNMVKKNVLNFHKDLKRNCERKGRIINDIRVRVIAFGDYQDACHAESGLLNIPGQKDQLQNFVNNIVETHGGDGPEDGFEALAVAMDTPWDNKSTRRRHIIVLYTDASPHLLGTRSSSPYYPDNMPQNFEELTNRWNNMNNKARRLVLFAPDDEIWNRLSKEWDNVIHETEDLNTVLSGKGYDQIIESICESL